MRIKYFGKTAIIGVVSLLLIVLILLIVPAIAANPSFPDYVGIGPDDNECTLLNGDGGTVKVPLENTKITESNNPVGNVLLQCKLKDDPFNEEGAVRWDYINTNNLKCAYRDDITTTEWQIVVSASGNATLTCHIETAEIG